MKLFAFLSVFGLLAGLVAAVPTPAEVAPRCGTTYYPTIIQELTEAAPNTVSANTVGNSNQFFVSQTVSNGGVSNRIYEFVGFQGIAPGSYGCQLNLAFPAGYPITAFVGNNNGAAPQLNVSAVLRGNPAAVAYPNTFTFANFQTQLAPSQGLFGTVTAYPGETVAINSESCDTSLGFLFSIASWTGQSAGAGFTEQHSPLAGLYLTTNC